MYGGSQGCWTQYQTGNHNTHESETIDDDDDDDNDDDERITHAAAALCIRLLCLRDNKQKGAKLIRQGAK